ncbi:MAG: hypothetical protein M0Z51_13155 [Propionibacterium sp.]|nr:hypothetical protein [Propionibacterium sp.]
MSTSPLPREDFEAALAARKELGADYEPALVDSFVEKVEAALVARGQQRQQLQPAPTAAVPPGGRVAVAIVSVVMGIPLTAITLGTGSLFAMIICWLGIVGVNLAMGLHRGPA